MNGYYNTLIELWLELDLFDKINWSCANDGLKYAQKLKKEHLFDFLHGLNKDLDEVRE